MSPARLEMYVIYRHPRDYPERYVVRRWLCSNGPEGQPDNVPLAVTESLEWARRAVPAGCVNIGRENLDDPAIAEVWV